MGDYKVERLSRALREARTATEARSAFRDVLPWRARESVPPLWPFWPRFAREAEFVRRDSFRRANRENRLRVGLEAAASQTAPQAYQPEAALEAEEAVSLLSRAAADLPPALASLFTLAGRLELSTTEQAAALEVDEIQLRKLRKRLFQSLREALKDKVSSSVLAFFPRPLRSLQAAEVWPTRALKGHGGRVAEVWYGTNRVPIHSNDHSKGYTGSPEPNGIVHHGRCRVFIPEGHTWGELHTPLWKKLLFLWRPLADLKLLQIRHMPEDTFVDAMREALADKMEREKDVLLYVHGYNVSFESAALRAAQLDVDLNAAGATAFFSWPSKGATEGYLADEETIRISEKPLMEFVRLLHEKIQARRIHVLVHSMGNRALARLAELFGHLSAPVLGEVVLAAPDVNVLEFKDQAKGYKTVASRTTMYASSGDRALLASKTIHTFQRAGQLPPPVVVDGIHTIDVSDADLSFMGHGYYGACEAVLYDMHELFVGGLPPGKRARLEEVTCPQGQTYWRIRK